MGAAIHGVEVLPSALILRNETTLRTQVVPRRQQLRSEDADSVLSCSDTQAQARIMMQRNPGQASTELEAWALFVLNDWRVKELAMCTSLQLRV